MPNNNKSYNNINDMTDIIEYILKNFGDNEYRMGVVKDIIHCLKPDGDTVLFDSICYKTPESTNCCYSECNFNENEDRDWIRIFDEIDISDLNRAIKHFEKEFNDIPYLIMSESTLVAFEESVGCHDRVVIEHDCEKHSITSSYLYTNTYYSIVVDNDLPFGVVKVR